MTITSLLYNLNLNILIFSTSLNSSLMIFIRTYTINYRNALDRHRVRMNIILFTGLPLFDASVWGETLHPEARNFVTRNWSLCGSPQWRFRDPSLHRFDSI